MNFFLVLPYYLAWHYGRAYYDIKNIWFNFLFFIYHFFSIPMLLRTLFSPFERINDDYSPKTSFFETFVFNTIMRFFGFVLRTFFIILGSACLLATLFLGVIFFVFWIFLPFFLFTTLIWGIKETFT